MSDETPKRLGEVAPEDTRLPDLGHLGWILADREGAEDDSEPRLRQRPALARILLVEDERGVREAVSTFLTEQGYDVVTAPDGRRGLDLLRESAAFDLVILDIRMPGLNGWEFRAEQKSDAALAAIPVVVLTGDASPQARAIDADALLGKPVVPAQLLATVRRLLRARDATRRQRAQDEAGALGAMGRVLSRLGDEMRPCVGAALDAVELARHDLEALSGMGTPRVEESQRAVVRMLGASVVEMRRLRRLVGNLREPRLPGTTPRMGWVDLNAILAEAERLMGPEIERRAQFLSRHVPLPPVRGDAASLCQVFLNLLQNAVDAIPLSTSRDHQISFVSGRDGPNIIIEVADTGVGIPGDLMGGLFNFSQEGQGEGRRPALGLPVARQIVVEHGGTLTLESRVSRGTWARVTLSQAADWTDEDRTDEQAAEQGRAPILLVEDPTAKSLTFASDESDPPVDLIRVQGLDALRTLLSEGFRFDLILCDISVIATAVRSVREEVNQLAPGQWEQLVVLASDPTSPQALSYGSFLRCAVIAKPRDAATLSALVERLMERRRKMLC